MSQHNDCQEKALKCAQFTHFSMCANEHTCVALVKQKLLREPSVRSFQRRSPGLIALSKTQYAVHAVTCSIMRPQDSTAVCKFTVHLSVVLPLTGFVLCLFGAVCARFYQKDSEW